MKTLLLSFHFNNPVKQLISKFKSIILIVLLLPLNSLAQQSQNRRERKAVALIENLKEIKKAKEYFKHTDGPLHIYVDGDDGKNYTVRAAQFKGGTTFTYFLFYVNPDKNTIRYWDIPADTIFSLAQWRKQNLKRK